MTKFEREVRAARNQAMFRAVNEKMRELNEALANLTDEYSIACECADSECFQMLTVRRADYCAVRSSPRQFVIMREHVVPEIERVVWEMNGYVVVEKLETAGEVATALAEPAAGDERSVHGGTGHV
jgi:hypothetical protein